MPSKPRAHRTPRPSALSALGRRTEAPPIAWMMEQALARPALISLAAGFTDNETLPVAEAGRQLARLLGRRRTGEPALQYGSTPGLPGLRQLTAERLNQMDAAGDTTAPEAAPDDLVITHGSQQLLYLVTEVLCDPGDIVLVEDPTYFVYLGIAQSHGLECRGLRLEADGFDVAHLEQVLAGLKRSGRLSRVKLLYLVSYYQNPTGTTTRADKKAAALDLLRHYERAAGHPLFLLEDAAYRELRFAGEDVPSALTCPGARERVIYTSTYSKPFATGVRVGYARLPADLREAVLRVKANHDFGTSSLLQHLMLEVLASGAYSIHLERLRRRYARKARWLTAGLRRHAPAEVQFREPTGGMYVWAALPRECPAGLDSALFERALARDVLYVPGQLCYAPDPTRPAPQHELRLSYGNASQDAIEAGSARLGAVLHEFLDPLRTRRR